MLGQEFRPPSGSQSPEDLRILLKVLVFLQKDFRFLLKVLRFHRKVLQVLRDGLQVFPEGLQNPLDGFQVPSEGLDRFRFGNLETLSTESEYSGHLVFVMISHVSRRCLKCCMST